MKFTSCGAALAVALSSASVTAQSTPVLAQPSAAPMPVGAPTTGMAVLRVGTEVPLRLAEMLTTKDKMLKVGQRVRLEVAEAVLVNGVVVIPSGSPAVGEITEVRNKGMWGKSGHFTGRALYAVVSGRQLRLSGVFDDKGKAGGGGAAAVSALVFLPAGFFMTGTSAKMDIGTPVRAFMDEDVQLAMPATAPAPMIVARPVVAPVAATPVVVATPK